MDPYEYQNGYSEALSVLDTYGLEQAKSWAVAPWRSRSWVIGWNTALGVAFERTMMD